MMGTLAIHMGIKIVNVVFLYNTRLVSSIQITSSHTFQERPMNQTDPRSPHKRTGSHKTYY
uniref:Uncharacterized protein n=1 Tax=Picea glauca TaxID=3330 RepID=A0A101LU20_PICGL|nr:hypothetical protein ABT39_MTgene3427 [Picea glauca]